ncbi:MAG: glycosyltransferase family 2 protein [Deltaproteobacteria bacterium]|nr:glycosyltransferase family 2 protein [Deltaproteobacteria bacterium]
MSQQIDIPLVSIITPTLNSEIYIRDNIRSVLSQTYPNIEHIIIDGGSTDKTIAIVREMDPNAIIISEPDEGISDAFNKGLKLAKGDIIAILNSDDYYEHNMVIERVAQIFESDRGIKWLYGKVRGIDPVTGKAVVVYGESFSMGKMKKRLIIPHPAVFACREVYEKVGLFSLEYKISMDYDYLLRAAHFYNPLFLDEKLTVLRLGGASTKHIYLAHRETYRIMRANGVWLLAAVVNLLYRYWVTTASLLLQKSGLAGILFSYRRLKGRL